MNKLTLFSLTKYLLCPNRWVSLFHELLSNDIQLCNDIMIR